MTRHLEASILRNGYPPTVKIEAFFIFILDLRRMEYKVSVAGIESIVDKEGNVFTYDVNTNTNYNAEAEKAVRKYGMLAVANYLGATLRQYEKTLNFV